MDRVAACCSLLALSIVACDSPAPQISTAAPIVSRPLAPAGIAGETLFAQLPASRTGIDFVHRWAPPPGQEAQIHGMAAGCGVAIGDVDGDGRPDLYLTHPYGGGRLYRNLGDFRFEDATGSSGLTDLLGGVGASFADVDNDEDLDLFVCGFGAPNRLFINRGDGTFRDEAAQRGLAFDGISTMMAFEDYDRDGLLDAYLLTCQRLMPDFPDRRDFYREGPGGRPIVREEFAESAVIFEEPPGTLRFRRAGQFDRLYHNEGGGRFRDVTREAGIRGAEIGLGVVWWDADDDGWPDLYVANDLEGSDRLYRNNRDGTFTDTAPKAFGHTPWFSMGVDIGDVDNDGLMDLFATDMAGTTHYKAKVQMGDMSGADAWMLTYGEPRQAMQNALFLNTGTGRFLEAAKLAGLASSDWTWAPRLADFDNDGRVDLFIANGMTRDFNNSDLLELERRATAGADDPVEAFVRFWNAQGPKADRDLAFRNLGDLRFEPTAAAWGLDHLGVSFGAALGDLDGDGDVDLVVGRFDAPPGVYRNDAGGRRLALRLKGRGGNLWGLGARLRLEAAGNVQIRRLTTARGYTSSDEPLVHFGLGAATKVDLLRVTWPSGRVQEFANLEADRRYEIAEPEGDSPAAPPSGRPTLFEASSTLRGVRHEDPPYDDFQHQPLLPWKLSQLGPGVACGDVDGDGLVDVVVGGGKGQPTQVCLNRGVRWIRPISATFERDRDGEDTACLLFDADGDGDLDLYVASGSAEFEAGAPALRDRLYLNDGKGAFVPSDGLPDRRACVGAAATADFDRDGDLDLFVGTRVIPRAYPTSGASALLRNEGGRFVEARELSLGMVTGAVGSDVDGDGWTDLLVTTEYGPVKLCRNRQGTLQEPEEVSARGWWQAIAAGDVDGDGDMDYAVTNLGLNTKYRASPERPMRLYTGPYGDGGAMRIVEGEWEDGHLFPGRGRSCSTAAMPALAQRFKTYDAFGRALLGEIYRLEAARLYEIDTLESGVLLNDGTGRFSFRPLPRIAQVSPALGVALLDADNDGRLDLVLAQNFHHPQPETPRMDGGVGLLLRGRGDGSFDPVRADRSGLVVEGDARAAATADLNGDGRLDLLVAQNNGELRAFENRGRDGGVLVVRLEGDSRGMGSRVRVQGGAAVDVSSPDGVRFSWSGAGILHVLWADGSVSDRPVSATERDVVLRKPLKPLAAPEAAKGGLTAVMDERVVEGRPVFRVAGRAGLPDGTLVRLTVTYGAREAGSLVAERTAAVENGSFGALFHVFGARTLPGEYVLTAQAASTAPVVARLRIGTEADAAAARRGYLDELAAAFDRLDQVCREIVAESAVGGPDWKTKVQRWLAAVTAEMKRFEGRPENAILMMGEPSTEGFLPVWAMVRDLCRLREAGRGAGHRGVTALESRMDRHRFSTLHRLGSTTEELEEARRALAQLRERISMRKEAADLMLEISGRLPQEAHADCADLVEWMLRQGSSAGLNEEGERLLQCVEQWVQPVTPERR